MEQLQGMSKKPSESFREYAQRWRQTACQVYPIYEKGECDHLCLRHTMIGHSSASFTDLVQSGEHIEDGLKIGKIK